VNGAILKSPFFVAFAKHWRMHSTNRYAEVRTRVRLREQPLIALPKIPNEFELQARWFAGEFGRDFKTATGEPIEVIQFGFWNREAGPDFQDAAIRIANGAILRGTIEIDLLDRNWELHGHATNTAFDDVILHVFLERSGVEFFARTSTHRNVLQVQLDLAALHHDTIETVPLAHAGRCVAPLRDLEADRITSVLEGAARFRLQHKANRLRQRIEGHTRDEVLFQAVAEALGYKQNRLAFTLLAQRLPLSFLRKRQDDAEALLFGIAGFLDALSSDVQRKSARSYLNSLWHGWWKYRAAFSRLILPGKLWKMSGVRPLNHPHRRLGALAALVTEWKRFATLTHAAEAAPVMRFVTGLRHSFWSCHYNLAVAGASSSRALIGSSRAADIVVNVIYPLAVNDDRDVWNDYKKLRAQVSSQAARIAAARLFADDPRQRKFTRSLMGQQGLLQIYEDFCLRDSSDCANCPFPEQLRSW